MADKSELKFDELTSCLTKHKKKVSEVSDAAKETVVTELNKIKDEIRVERKRRTKRA